MAVVVLQWWCCSADIAGLDGIRVKHVVTKKWLVLFFNGGVVLRIEMLSLISLRALM